MMRRNKDSRYTRNDDLDDLRSDRNTNKIQYLRGLAILITIFLVILWLLRVFVF